MSKRPAAYIHTLWMDGGQRCRELAFTKGKHSVFGWPGTDYSETYKVTVEPLWRKINKRQRQS